MNRNLARVMPHVFAHEGGYVDHPADPGGATNMGVTLRTLSAWRGRRVAKADVRALSRAEATEIYRRQYWAPIRGGELPGGVDYAMFDFAINSGPRRAVEYLQRIVGADVDGQIGIHTLACVKAGEPEEIVRRLCAARLRFLKRIRNRRTKKPLWPHFGRGWQRRVDAVTEFALQLAAEEERRSDTLPDGVTAPGTAAPPLRDIKANPGDAATGTSDPPTPSIPHSRSPWAALAAFFMSLIRHWRQS
jgi:lysozyme family protein